jgi:serine/threonine-protein kinase HipA
MAKAAGITMTECRLMEENGRRHFMTRRFDRIAKEGKLPEKRHMQSLAGLAHFDFNQAGAYSYEQAFLTMRQLRLTMDEIEEQFRRMVFNVIARNQDDHVKNIAYLMDKSGRWSLAPAFDITYSYNPQGAWTAAHQMTINGKRDHFTRDDFQAVAKVASMKRGRDAAIFEEVRTAVQRWREFADAAKVAEVWREQIQAQLRLGIN